MKRGVDPADRRSSNSAGFIYRAMLAAARERLESGQSLSLSTGDIYADENGNW